MNYIVKEKALTEERIINGTTLMRKSLVEYNKLLDFSKSLKTAFFDAYFKVKLKTTKDALPISKEELKLFRTLDETYVKSFIKEIGGVGESVLLTEKIHDEKAVDVID